MIFSYTNTRAHGMPSGACRKTLIRAASVTKTQEGGAHIALTNLEGEVMGGFELSHDEARELAISCLRSLYDGQ